MGKRTKINAGTIGLVVGSVVGGVMAMGSPSTASAAAIVTPSTTVLFANSASQSFSILIAGTDQIGGSDLWVQIGDGGPDNAGTTVAPKIVSVNMTAGTIFASNNTGENFTPSIDLTPDGLIAFDQVNATGTSTLLDSGILATITMSTVGFAPGTTFTVRLGNVGAVATGNAENTDIFAPGGALFPLTEPGVGVDPAATITLVSAVPEPASAGLILLGSAALLGRRRRA